MLKLVVKNVDILRIGKLLGMNKLKSSVTDSSIIIDSNEIADNIIEEILRLCVVISIQNYFESEIFKNNTEDNKNYINKKEIVQEVKESETDSSKVVSCEQSNVNEQSKETSSVIVEDCKKYMNSLNSKKSLRVGLFQKGY